jgi:hypothetical protein
MSENMRRIHPHPIPPPSKAERRGKKEGSAPYLTYPRPPWANQGGDDPGSTVYRNGLVQRTQETRTYLIVIPEIGQRPRFGYPFLCSSLSERWMPGLGRWPPRA